MENKENRREMWLDIKKELKGVKKVLRKAKEGEWILIIRPKLTAGLYEEGDILQVNDASEFDRVYCNGILWGAARHCIYNSEYVVLENYIPEEKKDKRSGHHPWGADKKTEEQPTIVEHLVKDRKTIVKLSNGKVGIAACSPEDEFDIYEGLRLATERAYGKVEPYKKPSPVKEVKRRAKKGEYIKITHKYPGEYRYENGDVLRVVASKNWADNIECYVSELFDSCVVLPTEYVVLENYRPEKK